MTKELKVFSLISKTYFSIMALLAANRFVVVFVSMIITRKSYADLESSSVREGNRCRVLPPDNVQYDDVFIFSTKVYSIPIASKFNYYQQAEAFLNRSARDDAELRQMCRGLEPNMQGFALETNYERHMAQSCVPLRRRGQYNCTTTFFSAGTNPSLFDKYVFSILGTDNKTWALLSRCTNDVFESYQLFTTSPDITKTTTSFKEVQDTITKYGFDPKKTIAVGCDRKCTSVIAI